MWIKALIRLRSLAAQAGLCHFVSIQQKSVFWCHGPCVNKYFWKKYYAQSYLKPCWLNIYFNLTMLGAWWLSGKVLDLRQSGRGFKPHRCHCVVSLSKTHLSLLSTGSTQEVPFGHNWKSVDWDVKNQIKQKFDNASTKNDLCQICLHDITRKSFAAHTAEPKIKSKSISGVTSTCRNTCMTPVRLTGDDKWRSKPILNRTLYLFMSK